MRIKTKLVAYLLAISLIPLVFSMVLSLWYVSGKFERLSLQSAKERLHYSAEVLSGYFSSRLAEVEAYVESPLIKSMEWSVMRPFLREEVERHQGIYEKFIVGLPDSTFHNTIVGNPALNGLASFDDSDPKAKLKSIHKRGYWQALVGTNEKAESRTHVSNPMISYTTGVKQVVVGASVRSEGGHLAGMLGGAIPWEEIEARVNAIRDEITQDFGESVQLSLVDSEGIYIYHHNPEKVVHLVLDNQGQPVLNDIGEKTVALYRITEERSAELSAAGRMLIQGKHGHTFYQSEDGNQQIAALYAPVKAAGYGLIMTLPKVVIHAPVTKMQFLFGLFILLTIIIVVIFAVISAQRVVHRILELNKAAHAIADGDYSSEIRTSGKDEISELAQSFRAMADKVRRTIKALHMEHERLEVNVKERTIELQEANEKLKVLATTDHLTQLNNRIYLEEKLRDEVNRYSRDKVKFSVLLLDLDHFKQVNDNYGHDIGDSVLAGIAKVLQDNVRDIDTVSRYGGEEFMVVCPGTDLEGGRVLAEKLREKIEQHGLPGVGNVTASFGVVVIEEADGLKDVLKRADKALYRAKEAGRNQVIIG